LRVRLAAKIVTDPAIGAVFALIKVVAINCGYLRQFLHIAIETRVLTAF